MTQAFGLYQSSIGKKVVMAGSGVLLLGFVVMHMIGNLKIFLGQADYDAYAAFLREFGAPALGHGELLWLARLGLLAAVCVHIVAAVQLTLMSRAARTERYQKPHDVSLTYASRTMRWGGVIVAAFVLYHLLHLTFGTVHVDFEEGAVYANVVSAFSQWPVALAYITCMLPLGLHIYHGAWSITQTLGFDGPRVAALRRIVAAALALGVTLGNISIPLAILAGLVR
ncbi:MAG: succinate dehydrogenase cytochrome b subunit [Vicinamibacterales bacterium]|jgi:succinate dehydrogenase / fumarate reductase cytochrome b subunit|nr:succinate dehydrogenase cytochrome b subunit [Vicinamibacterales bacterium]